MDTSGIDKFEMKTKKKVHGYFLVRTERARVCVYYYLVSSRVADILNDASVCCWRRDAHVSVAAPTLITVATVFSKHKVDFNLLRNRQRRERREEKNKTHTDPKRRQQKKGREKKENLLFYLSERKQAAAYVQVCTGEPLVSTYNKTKANGRGDLTTVDPFETPC